MKFIGKILPVDGYFVILRDNLPVDYAISLTHLYQPLIGIEAITLYQTLLHEIDIQESSVQTHHTLMNYLNIPLNDLYEARLKLEGIGLLKTYEKITQEITSYTYELISPFSPKSFFKDTMFSELLFHHLGEDKYLTLKNHFFNQPTLQMGTDITTSFNKVFQTFRPTLDSERPIDNGQDVESSVNIERIDFSWMEQMLTQRMIPVKKVLTAENKKIITQMMHLYDLTSYEIEKSVLWALTEENILDVEEFTSACHDIFKTKENTTPIRLIVKTEERRMDLQKDKPITKEEQLIRQLEVISPKQLLEDLSSGNQASEQDLRLIREVMISQGLPAPVMNVLIHYVLLQSNMRLSRSYIETIASHWSRANLKTAKEAMNFAKQEIEKYRQGTKKTKNYRKPVSQEVIPDWFKDRNKKVKKEAKQEDPEAQKERRELAALLQKHSSDN